MKKIDLKFLIDEPVLDKTLVLNITPLAPLSMVNKLPGKYYHSEKLPTHNMIYGLLENLMGLHLAETHRNEIIKEIKKSRKKQKTSVAEYSPSGSKYTSVLQEHILIESIEYDGFYRSFDDLWSQHLKRGDEGHFGGSRNYDWRLEENLTAMSAADQIKYYPYYYVSPTNREYIIYYGNIKTILKTTVELFAQIVDAVNHPHAPAYLGSNDGWVDLRLEETNHE